MIISRGRNYLFVHIPKTGGTSLAMALESKAMADDIMIGDTPKAKRRRRRLEGVVTKGRLWKHSTLRDAEGLIEQKDMEDMFVFTLIRNPWDRLASYYFWLREQDFSHLAVERAKDMGFEAFIRDRDIMRSIQASPYPSYVCDSAGVDRCNLYIRLEHLEEDIPALEQALEIKLGQIPVVNTSQRAPTGTLFSDADKDHIAKLCAADIERFGYRFPT